MNFSEWLAARPWTFWLPAPAVMVHSVILSRSSRVWTEIIVGSTRSGRPTHTLAAHFYLGMLGLSLVFYALVGWSDAVSLRGAWLARQPTEDEHTVARGFVRGLVLIVMYLGTFALWREFG